MVTTAQIAEITQWLQQTDPAPETPYYRDTRRYIQTLLDACADMRKVVVAIRDLLASLPCHEGDPARVETLAAELHAIYQAESKRQGIVKHPDDYNHLPDRIKEFDRVIARFILEREEKRALAAEDDCAALQELAERDVPEDYIERAKNLTDKHERDSA